MPEHYELDKELFGDPKKLAALIRRVIDFFNVGERSGMENLTLGEMPDIGPGKIPRIGSVTAERLREAQIGLGGFMRRAGQAPRGLKTKLPTTRGPQHLTEAAEPIMGGRAADRALARKVFGTDEAKRYERLQRAANNPADTKKADRAADEIAKMESRLTKAQQDELFGMRPQDAITPAMIEDQAIGPGAALLREEVMRPDATVFLLDPAKRKQMAEQLIKLLRKARSN